MAYTPTVWVNDNTPAMNEDNLNKIEQGILDAHNMIEEIDLTFPHEAPDDDIKYSRQNKEWVPDIIQNEPPQDNKKYGWKNGEWSEILEGDSTGFDYEEAVNKPALDGVEFTKESTHANMNIGEIFVGDYELHSSDFEDYTLVSPYEFRAKIPVEGMVDTDFSIVAVRYEYLKYGTINPQAESAEDGIYIYTTTKNEFIGSYVVLRDNKEDE